MKQIGNDRRFYGCQGFFFFVLLLVCSIDAWGAPFFKEGLPPFSIEVGGEERLNKERAAAFPRFPELVKELSPAVVNISVESENEEDAAETQVPGHPFFKKDPNSPFRSLGSGFIVSEDGYIVTNNHVIDNSSKIVARLLDDKTEYVAKLIAKDQKTDLALLKIKPKGALKTVYFGDSDAIDVGEWVIAIGNQFQLGQTVTAGIVSAKSRRVNSRFAGPYDAFIQTDASINPGSSGGPLFNTRGQVIGINTAIFSPGKLPFGTGGTGFNIGIGFAIPINLVKSVISQLKDQGRVTRGVLGVVIQPVDTDLAEAMGLKSPYGALVADVLKASPASSAGFKRKDVIVGYNGQPVREHDELPLMVANTPVGSVVELDVIRDGQTQKLTAKIDELKEGERVEEAPSPVSDSLGLVVEKVTDDIAKVLGLDIPGGVVVNSVEPNSAGDKGGLNKGDVIAEIAGEEILDEESYQGVVSKLKKGKPQLVLVKRKEGTRFLTVKIK